MTALLLLILGFQCIYGMVSGLKSKAGVYQIRFLASAVFAGFVLLQLIGISNLTGLPPGALDQTIFMSILCLGALHLGCSAARRPFQALDWEFDQRKLLLSSIALSALGAIFYFRISRMAVEITEVQWTGTIVAYNFFAQALAYGAGIAAIVYARSGSRMAMGIVAADLLIIADRIFVSARRGETMLLVSIILLAIYFRRGFTVPRIVAVASVFIGTLFLYSTGDYRNLRTTEQLGMWEAVAAIQYLENMKQVFADGGPELLNTLYMIDSVDKSFLFDFGAFHWNTLVFNYVPAQLFGAEFKESLMLLTETMGIDFPEHEVMIGTTFTGMADAFRSFWYFGAVKFFVIAYVIQRMFISADLGHRVMQILYMLMLTNALHTVTHHTSWFISPWVHIAAFLLPALLFARVRTVPALRPAQGARAT